MRLNALLSAPVSEKSLSCHFDLHHVGIVTIYPVESQYVCDSKSFNTYVVS